LADTTGTVSSSVAAMPSTIAGSGTTERPLINA
jgi:hypothetical protein